MELYNFPNKQRNPKKAKEDGSAFPNSELHYKARIIKTESPE